MSETLVQISRTLSDRVGALTFGAPVTHVQACGFTELSQYPPLQPQVWVVGPVS